MKKLAFILILTFLTSSLLLLTACGGEPEAVQPPQNTEPQETVENTPDEAPVITAAEPEASDDAAEVEDNEPAEQVLHDFTFKMGDVLIEMNQEITYVVERLGEPLGILERPSCAFDGMDIIYGYPDVEIFTYPIGNTNHVHTINFINDSPRTLEGGIRMGAPLQAVIDAYGEDFEYDTGMYTFQRGLTTLSFFIEDDIVWGITYGLIIE